jgi:hypothetical protein
MWNVEVTGWNDDNSTTQNVDNSTKQNDDNSTTQNDDNSTIQNHLLTQRSVLLNLLLIVNVPEEYIWHKDKAIGWTNKELLFDFWQEQL